MLTEIKSISRCLLYGKSIYMHCSNLTLTHAFTQTVFSRVVHFETDSYQVTEQVIPAILLTVLETDSFIDCFVDCFNKIIVLLKQSTLFHL